VDHVALACRVAHGAADGEKLAVGGAGAQPLQRQVVGRRPVARYDRQRVPHPRAAVWETEGRVSVRLGSCITLSNSSFFLWAVPVSECLKLSESMLRRGCVACPRELVRASPADNGERSDQRRRRCLLTKR